MRTSLYSILCIVIRLGAVLLAFSVLGNVVTMVLSWHELPVGEVGYTLGFVGSVLLVAFLLWLYPGPLARAAAGRSSQQIFETPIDASHVQWIAMSVLGMYFVISGLIGLSSLGFNRFLMSSFVDAMSEQARRQTISDVLYWVVQIALGLVLALGAKGLSGALQQLRYGAAASVSE